ncbi:MAG: transcriptional regulator NrdR [Candidatus Schekmanbacteria bacterium RBG_16_38_10]|uniref:Transcriptional repressor NrdR n=1 Tax=Candidatus Schekmanbacteria bacterium RBG_16_38_10 TaxID=1817879 RepID=A0A1F7S0A9_9BACT|nr:MAG: transcriptional regulator NrdR [Candidatus Schekmanbacteria bacterium RBG_16_38_10]
MKCPFCGKEADRVLDSRSSSAGSAVRRRRLCISCNKRYTTYERVDELKLYVVKKDGRRELFDRQKVLSGLTLACKKLPIPFQRLEDIVSRIELEIYEAYGNEVKSSYIGDMIMRELKELDHVAYVRFASYYRAFKDVNDFVEVAKEVRPIVVRRSSAKVKGKKSVRK